MATQLDTRTVALVLRKLGYYDGDPAAVTPTEENFRDDLERFQWDYGLKVDGWYGKESEGVLLPLAKKLDNAPANLRECRRWQLTSYWVGDVKAHSGPLVPMQTPSGQLLARVPAGAFVEAALEGATRLADGRLVGVAHPAYSTVSSDVFKPVYDIAKRQGWIPEKPGYAGLQLSNGVVVGARNFDVRKASPAGWPLEAKGIPCDPFRTLAADNGLLPKHDPKFKGKGGVIPAGTRVWVIEFVGLALPDGTVHDGWCTVNDTGGGIFGAHCDWFVGTKALRKKVKSFDRIHIWFEGIEARLPMNYSYGL